MPKAPRRWISKLAHSLCNLHGVLPVEYYEADVPPPIPRCGYFVVNEVSARLHEASDETLSALDALVSDEDRKTQEVMGIKQAAREKMERERRRLANERIVREAKEASVEPPIVLARRRALKEKQRAQRRAKERREREYRAKRANAFGEATLFAQGLRSSTSEKIRFSISTGRIFCLSCGCRKELFEDPSVVGCEMMSASRAGQRKAVAFSVRHRRCWDKTEDHTAANKLFNMLINALERPPF